MGKYLFKASKEQRRTWYSCLYCWLRVDIWPHICLKFWKIHMKIKIKEGVAQTYSREKVFLEISKNTFSCRTPPMAASEIMNIFVDVSLFFREWFSGTWIHVSHDSEWIEKIIFYFSPVLANGHFIVNQASVAIVICSHLLNLFQPLVSFHTPRKHQKTRNQGVWEETWHELG